MTSAHALRIRRATRARTKADILAVLCARRYYYLLPPVYVIGAAQTVDSDVIEAIVTPQLTWR